MIATNRAVRQARRQLFASGHTIVTPFYNRAASKAELQDLFASPEDLAGTAVVISAPFGTGKTFFIETVAPALGIAHRDAAMRVPDLSEADLQRAASDVLFLDEADTKTSWEGLDGGLALIGEHLASSGRIALLLGDYALRNQTLLQRLPALRHLTTFEPLDQPFLEGVIRERLNLFIGGNADADVNDVIEPELYEVLAPPGMTRVSSFRTILAFLERVAGELPHDSVQCSITVAMARERAAKEFDPNLSARQERFLNEFLDYIGEHHPRGSGLEDGFDREMMLALGRGAGYESWDDLADEIIEPFGSAGVLLCMGTPGHDEDATFRRFVEPFFPSLVLMLLAD